MLLFIYYAYIIRFDGEPDEAAVKVGILRPFLIGLLLRGWAMGEILIKKYFFNAKVVRNGAKKIFHQFWGILGEILNLAIVH